MRQTNEIMYVASSALTAREPMALNATCDPMFIRDRRVVIKNVTNTALRGMFHPGLTCRAVLVYAKTATKSRWYGKQIVTGGIGNLRVK